MAKMMAAKYEIPNGQWFERGESRTNPRALYGNFAWGAALALAFFPPVDRTGRHYVQASASTDGLHYWRRAGKDGLRRY